MKKEKILKQKIVAIVLSLVLAVTTIIVPSVMSARDVSAAEDNQTVFKNLMMAVMLSGNSDENFGEENGTVDDATAAYYTALKYYSEGKTEIGADEFCKSMSANFQGSKTYSKDVLLSIAQASFIYDGADTVTVNAGAGDSLLSYFLGEKQNSDGSTTMYGVWKDWADTDIEPYFVALKVKAGKIISYSQVESEFNMNFFDGYGINILPKSSITLKAGLSLNGYKSSAITYRWSSKALNINNAAGQKDATYGSLYTIPSSKTSKLVSNGTLTITAYVHDDLNGDFEVASTNQAVDVKNCNLSLAYRHFVGNNTETGKGTTLKAGDSYWFSLNGADFAWDFGNGSGSKRQTFYKIECKLNGKTLTATEVEKNLKNSELSIGIGAGGGCPNRIIVPKKSGKLTIKATLYRNGKYFKSYSKTYTVKKFTVKKTSFKSAKNAKGKKIALKWKKNTSGTGYQVQYATDKKFAKECKTKTISKNKTTSYTIKSLKKKKTYYVRIRTYKKLGNTYYSGWSSAKKVKINK